MPRLSDAKIRATLRTPSPATLSDGDGKGTGRLLLRWNGKAADWYQQGWQNGKRTLAKLGRYPGMSLAEARQTFAARSGHQVVRSPVTVGELFEAYCDDLDRRGSGTATKTRVNLARAAEAIGRSRPASAVTADDVVTVLRPIHARGSEAMANQIRNLIHAAYGWALKADHDYRRADGRRFGLSVNPASYIPVREQVAGDRWLSADEFRAVWFGLQGKPHHVQAVRLILATGARPGEILGDWRRDGDCLMWERTKNGLPHVLPVPAQALEILEAGWRPDATVNTLNTWLYRTTRRDELPVFTLRDCRRTWKTLAGQAGLSKVERDLIQNHARADVSAKHYDRYDNLREKREAMQRWQEWLSGLLAV